MVTRPKREVNPKGLPFVGFHKTIFLFLGKLYVDKYFVYKL